MENVSSHVLDMVTASKHNQFSRRLFYSIIGLFIVFAACFLTYQYQREREFKIELLNEKLQSYNDILYNLHKRHMPLPPQSKEMRITLIALNGEVIYDNHKPLTQSNHRDRKEVKGAIYHGSGYDVRRVSETTGINYFYSATRYKDCIVRTALPYGVSLSNTLKVDNHFLWFTLIISIILIVVLYRFSKRLGTAIDNLRIFAQQADRNESINLELLKSFPHNELGEISQHLIQLYKQLQDTQEALQVERDRVVTSLEDQIRIKKQLTQNISHELKTPVSSIQGYLETIVSNKELPKERVDSFLEKCYAQSNRLARLLRDISVLTRMDEAPGMTEMEQVNLNNLVTNIIGEVSLELEEKRIDVINTLKKGLELRGNYSLLYSVFRNLMDNAIAYAGNNIQIRIECTHEDEKQYHFLFSDSGCGLTEEHLPHIFERFYRADKGRSRKLGGTGLGLAIVKNAVLIHGGNIIAKQRQGGGLEFCFSLNKNIK